MGFNWVAFVQQAKAESMAKSPHAVVSGLYHNYVGSHWREIVADIAEKHNEPFPDGLHVVDAWHSSQSRYIASDDYGVRKAVDWNYASKPLEDGTDTIEVQFDSEYLLEGPCYVAFGLNDMISDLEKSPKTIAYMLANPRIDNFHNQWRRWGSDSYKISQGFQEPNVHSQAIDVIVGNEPGQTNYYVATGNCLTLALFVTNQKNRVLLALPTTETGKKENRIRARLKQLKKEKRLKTIANQMDVYVHQLNTFISHGESHWETLKKILQFDESLLKDNKL